MTTDTSGRTYYTNGEMTLDDEQFDARANLTVKYDPELSELARTDPGAAYRKALSRVTRGFHQCDAPAGARASAAASTVVAEGEDDRLETRARELQRTDPELIALTGRDAHEGYKAALRKADRELFATER